MNLLENTAIGGLIIQFITGVIELSGIFENVKSKDQIVKDILQVELIAQFVEFIFYVYLVYKIFYGSVQYSITSYRYIDWVITTPILLVNLILFFKYLKEKNRKIDYVSSLKEEKQTIIKILIANGLMLLFGYLAETGIIDTPLAVSIGFLPFAFIFKQLYSNYVTSENISIIIYYIVFLIWGLYGVAAVLPFILKNSFYNVLDLFSKNAYGLFLYFYIQKIKI